MPSLTFSETSVGPTWTIGFMILGLRGTGIRLTSLPKQTHNRLLSAHLFVS
jgi:hypothetical protein